MNNEKVKLMFDYLQGPIRTSDVETVKLLTSIDIIDGDKVFRAPNLRCIVLYLKCYDFKTVNQSCTFNKAIANKN